MLDKADRPEIVKKGCFDGGVPVQDLRLCMSDQTSRCDQWMNRIQGTKEELSLPLLGLGIDICSASD